MSILGVGAGAVGGTGFYPQTIDQSLRFEDGDTVDLYKNFSASNRKTNTYSFWIKRGNLGSSQIILSGGVGTSLNDFWFHFEAGDILTFRNITSNAYNAIVSTTRVFRDTTNWYHIMLVLDTSQGTSSNRVKMYVNGEQETLTFSTTPSVNADLAVNYAGNFYLGRLSYTATQWLDGYLAEVNFVDGQALEPEAFGQTKNGVWIPDEYSVKVSQIAQNTGTAIGDMPELGGLAGAFNGTKFNAYSSSAGKYTTTTAYIGKNWGSSKTITGFILYSPTQYGFGGSGASTFTVKLYGSNSSPSNGTDGTLLYTSSSVNDNLVGSNDQRGAIRYFVDTKIQSEETISNFTTTAFSYHWVLITLNTTESIHVGQIEFYEDGSSNYYGTNGFRLKFNNSNDIGEDSANSNDFTATSGLASTDVVPDSPTNNFAVLNPLAKSSGITLAEGNLKWSSGTYNYQGTTATIAVPTSGKWYFECLVVTAGAGTSHDFGIGLVSNTDDSPMGSQINNNTFNNGAMYISRGDSGSRVGVDGSAIGFSDTLSVASGGIMQCAFDADSGKIWFGEDNNWYDSSYSTNTTANAPSAGANQTATIDANHQYVIQFNGYTNQYVAVGNFGADSSFAGNKTSGSANATDGKYGDFYYTPPTGFLALCTANLPDTTLSPNKSEQADDYFGAIIYDGSASNQTITLNFQADWLWFKERTTAGIQPQIFDSSRGHATSGAIFQSRLEPNGVLSETDSVAVQSQSGNDLVLLGGVSTTNDASGRKYVMWHWRAGGSTPTKTYKVKVVADSTDYGHGTGSNKYQFFKSDGTTGFGTNGVDLDVQEGATYIFDWSDSSAQGHPIRFSLTNDGTHSSGTSAGSEYTTGVVKDDSNYKTTITIQSGVASLYLYCANHSGMGFEVKTNISHGSSNFDGDIVSVVQTSDTAKFSMLTFTGNGDDTNNTIGHGLGVKPAWYIVKDRDTNSAGHWMVYHHELSNPRDNMFLNLENASNAQGFGSTDPATSTTIKPAVTTYTNNNGSEYIAYVFAEVEGYSKMGHYIATGTSGDTAPFVYTGFRPAFVMVKNSSSSSYADWVLFDNKRDPDNIVDEFINISTEAEFTGGSTYPFMDFLSNGFKLRLGGTGSQVAYAVNRASSDRYIYIAFAEQPFHLSNAR